MRCTARTGLALLSVITTAVAAPRHDGIATAAPVATFAAPVRVNDEGMNGIAASTESAGGRAIAVRGEDVFAAWADERSTPACLRFARSADRGVTWGTNVTVADSIVPGAFPALAVGPDGAVYVAWQDFRTSPLAKIRVARSTDRGATFGPSAWASASLGAGGWDGHPALACAAGDTVHVAWTWHHDSERRIAVATSTDGAVSFRPALLVESRCRAKGDPVLAAGPGGRVTIAWRDWCDAYRVCGFDDDFCGTRIFRVTSTNGGATFGTPLAATPLYGPAADPSIVETPDGQLLLAWSGLATRTGLPNIHVARNPTGGYDYTTPGIVRVDPAGGATATQERPSLAASAGNLVVAWRDERGTARAVYAAASDDGGVSFGPATGVSTGGREADHPSAAWSPEAVMQLLWTEADGAGGNDVLGARGAYAGTTDIGTGAEAPGRGDGPRFGVQPNPGRAGLRLAWSGMEGATTIRVTIHDVLGRRVRVLAWHGAESASRGAMSWDGRDDAGAEVAGGVYFAELSGGAAPFIRRFVLVR